jgi:hypothetical protein
LVSSTTASSPNSEPGFGLRIWKTAPMFILGQWEGTFFGDLDISDRYGVLKAVVPFSVKALSKFFSLKDILHH